MSLLKLKFKEIENVYNEVIFFEEVFGCELIFVVLYFVVCDGCGCYCECSVFFYWF